MKVIIIEDDKQVNNAKASQSEKLYNSLRKMGVDVYLIESAPRFLSKPLTNKQQKKSFLTK